MNWATGDCSHAPRGWRRRSPDVPVEEPRDDHERLTAAVMASDVHLIGADVAALGFRASQLRG